MSSIAKTSVMFSFLLALFVLTLAGCGSSNSESSFDSVAAKHPAGWLPGGHAAEARARMENCADCHGADFQGGIAQTACTDCHLGNQNSYHPIQWGSFAYALHGGYAKTNGTTSCANVYCHGENLGGVSNSGPSCTSCHIGGPTAAHPAGWDTDVRLHQNYVNDNGVSSCSNIVCHGAEMKPPAGGAICSVCH